LVPILAAGLLAGCGDDSSGPNTPPPADLSSPRAALGSLAELYSRRQFTDVLAMHSPDFRFHAARPESISFLEPGETWWDFDRESEILERLLVPERITWLDQVLLETTIEELVDSTATTTRITAETELTFLVGDVNLVHSRSRVDFLYEKSGNGDWLLAEQFEHLYPGSELTYGQLKARVEDPPSVSTLVVDPDSVSSTTAVLAGRVGPNGLATTYFFEWGPSAAYGSADAPASAGSDAALHVFRHTVTGLDPGTEYHYRIVASSLWGTSRGIDLTFTTDP
jgi:hypothetical protein